MLRGLLESWNLRLAASSHRANKLATALFYASSIVTIYLLAARLLTAKLETCHIVRSIMGS